MAESSDASRLEVLGRSGLDVRQLLREEVWDAFRAVARPDSRFHWDFSAFIPDFEGSELCADRVRALKGWQESQLLFITPDNSTEYVRRAAMDDGRPFLMTTYGIRRGFLLLDPSTVAPGDRAYAATLDGMDRYATPLSLRDVATLPDIGLLVTGGSAVTLAGVRLGKGHGYFDLEWALLSEVGRVDETSQIVDVVHDFQVVDVDVDGEEHDVPVDWIITPSRTIATHRAQRMRGRVYWALLAGTELESIPPVLELARLQSGEPARDVPGSADPQEGEVR